MKPAKYFDNVILGQFALTNVPVKVFVNGEYLTITDADDIEDPLVGFGMDENGGMVPFDYRYIDHLLVANNNITLDKYNKAMGAEDTEAKPEEAPEEEESTEKETKKEESTMKLKPMIEKAVSKAQQRLFGAALSVKRGDTKKSEVSKDVQTLAKSLSDKELSKFAGTKHEDLPEKKEEVTEDLGQDKKKASDMKAKLADLNLKIAKEEEKLAKKAKQNENIVGIDTISEPYIFQVGDIIKNVNPDCMHYGSTGIVKSIMSLPDEMGSVIKYTVTNSGDTYSPGDSLTKTMDQLSLVGPDYDDYEDDDYDSGDYDDWDIVSGEDDDDDYEYNSYDDEEDD